jgi:beta-glucosidase
VFLSAGGAKEVSFKLDKVSVSYWDDRRDCWVGEKGTYGVWVGTSSVDERAVKGEFEVEQELTWRGL